MGFVGAHENPHGAQARTVLHDFQIAKVCWPPPGGHLLVDASTSSDEDQAGHNELVQPPQREPHQCPDERCLCGGASRLHAAILWGSWAHTKTRMAPRPAQSCTTFRSQKYAGPHQAVLSWSMLPPTAMKIRPHTMNSFCPHSVSHTSAPMNAASVAARAGFMLPSYGVRGRTRKPAWRPGPHSPARLSDRKSMLAPTRRSSLGRCFHPQR